VKVIGGGLHPKGKRSVLYSTVFFFQTCRQMINMAGSSKCLRIDKLEKSGIIEELYCDVDSEV
jgi:hypothetical protein